jgi:hypothetical protein
LGFQDIQFGNPRAYRKDFVHLTLKYCEFGCGVNVHPTYVIVPGMWMFHTNLPSRYARSMNLMYVGLIIEHQQNYPMKYACDLYEAITY